MLTLVHDARSGSRLEIVVFVFNEAARIGNYTRCYADQFDVVVMDDGSTDDTVNLAIAGGATVFHRQQKSISGEAYFVEYVNRHSKSGRCILFCADEFVTFSDLRAASDALEKDANVVFARRVNYIFGSQSITFTSVDPRGFYKGGAVHDPTSLHGQLCVNSVPGRRPHPTTINMHHLHQTNFINYYGKFGDYLTREVDAMQNVKWPILTLICQYICKFVGFLLSRFWCERGIPIWMNVYLIVEKLCQIPLAVMAWLAKKSLPHPDEQAVEYSRFFTNERTAFAATPRDANPPQ